MPNLRIRDGSREYTFQIEGDVAVVGRGDTNDIDLEDAKASKEHFRIERVGQRWKLVDLESKNGTKVNGEFKNKAWLGHGDLVQIGTAEMRFGLEGTARQAAAPAGAPAPRRAAAGPARRGAPAREAEEREGEEGEEEEVPPRRYAKKNNTWLLVSLTSLGLLIFILVMKWGGDSVNVAVLATAKEEVRKGNYDSAIRYMEENGDPDQNDYVLIERYLADARAAKGVYEQNVRDRESKAILSRLGMLILSYNRGHVIESGPDKILPLMKELREKYAGTEAAESARKQWPAWYAGKVPQPASEVLSGSGRLRKDWDAAVERSEKFRKEWYFREAKETIERFVTEREAVLGAGDLATYEQLRDEELTKIDRLAESIYRGREAEAERLLKNKKYDEAIKAYAPVIEKFGIDAFVRKAQAEIAKIQKLKPGG